MKIHVESKFAGTVSIEGEFVPKFFLSLQDAKCLMSSLRETIAEQEKLVSAAQLEQHYAKLLPVVQ